MIFSLLEKLNSIKKFSFYFITPTIYAIGNASEQINLGINYVKKRNKKLIILKIYIFQKLLKYNVCNNELFNTKNFDTKYIYKKNLLSETLSFLVNIEFFFKRLIFLSLKKKIKFNENFIFPMIGIEAIYGLKKINLNNIKYKDIKKFDLDYSLIKLKKEIIDKCEKKIEKYNFNKNDRIVCLHVRDSVFRNDGGRKDYRNSNIENYLDTIKYLIQQNYKVVRMGKKSKIKLNFTNENFFDYSFSNIKDDLLDLYLIERCSFYIGTQSGILDVAQMFNKPILLTNMCELYTSFPRKKNDRGIFKKIYKKDFKEKISLEDFASMEFKYHDPQIEIEKLIFEQNNPQELLNATIEFLKINLAEKNNKNHLNNFQIKFNKKIKKQYERFFNQNDNKDHTLKKQTDALKMIRIFKSCEGSLINSSLT